MPLNPQSHPQALSHQYADCFIDPGRLPDGLLAAAEALVTGTLGLACQPTAETMLRAVEVAKGAGTTVRARSPEP